MTLTITQLIEQITKDQPTITLESLLDELERPAFENEISPDRVCKFACFFIAKREANLTGESQIIRHKNEVFEVDPN